MKNESSSLSINSPISDVKGIGAKKTGSLNRLGIFTLKDSAYFYPRAYEDLRNPINICDLSDGKKSLIVGRVLLKTPGKGFGRKKTLHLLVEDKTGRATIIFFMAGYMLKNFEIGEEYYFYGKIKLENGKTTIFHPEYSKITDEEQGIVPSYSLTKGLTQKDIRYITKTSCGLLADLPESLPKSVVESANICNNVFALQQIHYPDDEDSFRKARYRLVYEELFDFKLALALSKNRTKEESGKTVNSGKADDFIKSLSFSLTDAQRRTINEVLLDMRSNKNMNRLVQGDVGSGKTVVAEAAIFEAVFAGYQSVFMAPTEILALQHFNHLKVDFEPFGIKVVLLVSSMPSKEKKLVLEQIESGEAQVIVGTHALIQNSVKYKNVTLVITDEQHRFGVNQRKTLSEKGNNPDVLVMTATPIPRTLAVTLYADLDISKIDELPPGRKEIKTFKFKNNERKNAYRILYDEVSKGRQAYIVAPFIDDSESIDGMSATRLYNAFLKKHPEISCGLLHGEMSSDEKEAIMIAFSKGEISVLISTVVIEVGIDIPNATVMLIENTERFGLAQLHQLRGRVGRGEYESFCLLCTGEESEIPKQRVDIMCKTSDGFIIAEKDLELRGPGEFFGYKQHGIPQLILADPIKHIDILNKASSDVEMLLDNDPNLLQAENKKLYKKIEDKFMNIDNLTI